MTPTLLPSGLMDVLPPFAAQEFRLIHHFLRLFSGFGYQPVIPPLAEYAETMLAGQGEATSHHVFHVNDPLAPQLLGLRADMTGQIARIAGSSLGNAPRPLRLCYAGYTLRTTAEALKTRRQHTQVGIERFGSDGVDATAEVLAIACHALATAHMEDLTIDLHLPSVMQELLQHYPAAKHSELRDAVRLKDVTRLKALGANTLVELLPLTGPAASVLPSLKAHAMPAVQAAAAAFETLVSALAVRQVNATVTIDLLDLAGYGYYNGIGYTLYWNTGGIEVGRGGCYRTERGEHAVGFTLYINEVLEHLPAEKALPVKTIAATTPAAEAEALQRQGFITVYGE